jgi:hypothetical protein
MSTETLSCVAKAKDALPCQHQHESHLKRLHCRFVTQITTTFEAAALLMISEVSGHEIYSARVSYTMCRYVRTNDFLGA